MLKPKPPLQLTFSRRPKRDECAAHTAYTGMSEKVESRMGAVKLEATIGNAPFPIPLIEPDVPDGNIRPLDYWKQVSGRFSTTTLYHARSIPDCHQGTIFFSGQLSNMHFGPIVRRLVDLKMTTPIYETCSRKNREAEITRS